MIDPRALWDAEVALVRGQWESCVAVLILALLVAFAIIARWVDAKQPAWAQGVAARLSMLTARKWLFICGALWVLFWCIHHASDPNWVPSGIDWHDSHLDAYALFYDDPPLYCAWRYPFYPAVTAGISNWMPIDLATAAQLISRIAALALAWPLYIIGRALYGRAAAVSGILLLVGLATYRMHTDAVTPYPMVMILGVGATAALVAAVRGGVAPFAVIGLCTAGLLANDGKSLLIALGILAMALPMALLIPYKWRPGQTAEPVEMWKRLATAGGIRVARLALVIVPMVASYQWMHDLPVKAFTLEEMAVAYLVPGGRTTEGTVRNLQDGYMWGHFKDAWTVPRTLQTFFEAGRRPDMAEQNARQLRTSLQRVQMDYPQLSWRTVALLGVALVVPLVRRKQPWGERVQTVLGIGAVLVLIGCCLPSFKSDYQERYVVHGTVVLPLLLMGLIDGAGRLLTGRGGPIRDGIRGMATLTVAVLFLALPTGPLSVMSLSDRLDPVSMGGLQEYEVGEWGRASMGEKDVLLDTSWMMTALLLAGERTVARSSNAYPPGGAPWPAKEWRFSRPWPVVDAVGQTGGSYYALVNFLAMPPDTFNKKTIPLDEVPKEPDSPAGAKIAADSRWAEVFRSSDTLIRIYRYDSAGAPRNWRLHRRTVGG